ncbi:MAG: hypothetical protein K6A23_00300 [Butyrivibrio sp.]|nr:hypothetical protein [Butyrivibrio sp.]
MNVHLCKNDETIEEALEYINTHDADNRKFAVDTEADRCFIGDERFISAPVLINHKNKYYACRIVG